MAKDPAFLFYPGDFNTGTQFMNDDQVGKYMRLLMAQHQHGHLTENQVIFICKSYDKDIMSKFKKDSNGLWYNERLEIEVNKRKKFVESRSKNKEGKTKPKNTSSSYDSHMEDRNENTNVNIKPNNETPDFADYERWTKDIISGNDWAFTDKVNNMQIHINGSLEAAATSHLALLAKYPKMQPSDQNKFRVSLIGHIQDQKESKPKQTSQVRKKSWEEYSKGKQS